MDVQAGGEAPVFAVAVEPAVQRKFRHERATFGRKEIQPAGHVSVAAFQPVGDDIA